MNMLNRIKFIDSFERGQSYQGLINIGDLKAIVDKLSKGEKWDYSEKFMEFILRQKADMVDIIREKYSLNENIRRCIDSCEVTRIFTSKKEIEVMEYMAISDFRRHYDIFFDYISNGGSIDEVINMIESELMSGCCLGRWEVEKILNNKNLILMEPEKLSKIITVISECFDGQYDTLDKDALDIIFEPQLRFCRNINKENLRLVKAFESYLDEDDLTSLGNSSTGLANIDILIEALTYMIDEGYDKDRISKNAASIVDAIRYDIILDEADIRLIKNKLANGVCFEDNGLYRIAEVITNYTNESYTTYDYKKLVMFKKAVSKNTYKRILKSKCLIDELMHLGNYINEPVRAISSIIEFGQLTDENALKILKLCYTKHRLILNIAYKMQPLEYKLSYDEFMILLEDDNYISVEILNSIKQLKHSARILKLKEIIKIEKFSRYSSVVNGYKQIDDLTDGAIVGRMMSNANENPLGIKSFEDYLVYIVAKSKMNVDSHRKLNIIKFAGKEVKIEDILDKNLEEEILSLDRCKAILNELNLSDEFFEKYRDNLIDFLISEDCELLEAYLDNRRAKKIQRENIVLIAKAIIAGEYDNLKFVREDIYNEIRATMTDDEFDAWKRTDSLTEGNIMVEDASDFNTIMTIGAKPQESCMHYMNGGYSYCLLSNFDTSKKILKIHKNGSYIGRAILRLTKMSDTEESGANEASLRFIDVDSNSSSSNGYNNKDNQEMILFVEKLYTSVDNEEFAKIYPIVKEFLMQKAVSIGAKLVVSASYNYYESNFDYNNIVSKWVFITGSKNGEQYLDTFGGGTSLEHCYKKGDVIIYD